MATCKGCGAPVIWLPTVNGKMMCLDPKPIGFVEKPGARGKIFTDGRVVSCEYTDAEGAETGYLPHWATCPNAADFKRRKTVEANQTMRRLRQPV